MINIYTCGYDLRVGYTEGFNDGLTGKANERELPEPEWNSADKLDAEKSMTDSTETSPEHEDYAEGEKSQYYKTGYNWGYLHGNDGRERLKNELPKEQFEKSMGEFANSLKILYLQIKKEYYLVGITSLEPESEKASRTKFIDQFIKDPGEITPDKSILRDIQAFLAENNVQRAIDESVNYFMDRKDLGNFSFALSLKSKLMDLRDDSREHRIEKNEYIIEKKKLGKSLSACIEKCLADDLP